MSENETTLKCRSAAAAAASTAAVTPAPQDKAVPTNADGTNRTTTTTTTIQTLFKKQLGSTTVVDLVATLFVGSICIVGLLGLVASISIRQTFYHGSCCDMTFSAPRFFNVPFIFDEMIKDDDGSMRYNDYDYLCTNNDGTWNSNRSIHNPHKYRLLQFSDVRDLRFQQPSSTTTTTTTTTFNHYYANNNSNKECSINPITNPGHPVLYIHGHWGSFEQSRSLGAHGINLTQPKIPYHDLQRHLNHLLHSTNIYDVYTLDFHGEGGALHAYRLWEQAAFVEHAVRSIVHRVTISQRKTNTATYPNHEEYDPTTKTQVTIVAHSIGGMVARAAFLPQGTSSSNSQKPPHFVTNHVPTVITLATPHTSLPIATDESVHKFYKTVNSYWKKNSHLLNHVTLISISGGYRDEMIHPTLCTLDDEDSTANLHNNNNNRFSVLASTIGTYNPQLSTTAANMNGNIVIGMDHQAIVWCHNLLSSIRNILSFTNTAMKNNNTKVGLRELLLTKQDNDDSVSTTFAMSLTESNHILHKSLGTFGRIAYEASHISNLGNMVIFYCASCFLCTIQMLHFSRNKNNIRHAGSHVLQTIFLAVLLSTTNYKWCFVHTSAMCLSAIWAQMLNWTLVYILSHRYQVVQSKISFKMVCASALISEAILVGYMTMYSTIQQLDSASFKAIGFLSLFCFIGIFAAYHLLVLTSPNDRYFHYSSNNTLILLPVTLILLGGKALYAIALLTTSRGVYAQVDQGNELFGGVTLVLLPVLFQLGLSSGIDIFVAMSVPLQNVVERKSDFRPNAHNCIVYIFWYAALLSFCRWALEEGVHIVSFLVSGVATAEIAHKILDQRRR